MTYREYYSRLLHLQARAFQAGYQLSPTFAMRTLRDLAKDGSIQTPDDEVSEILKRCRPRWSRWRRS